MKKQELQGAPWELLKIEKTKYSIVKDWKEMLLIPGYFDKRVTTVQIELPEFSLFCIF